MNEVMTRLEELEALKGPIALAIGVFDGIHRGHQEVIRAAVAFAEQHDGTAVMMTFDPHPAAVLSPAGGPARVMNLRYQRQLAVEMGVSAVLALPFDRKMAAVEAEDFVAQLVRHARPLGCVSVGYTWSYGKDRAGTIHHLMDAGAQFGFAVYGARPVKWGERVISSTWLRETVRAGDLALARQQLGRSFGYLGVVVQGKQLGRKIGFPTANLRIESQVYPPHGVYACRLKIAGKWWPAVANWGRRPTVETAGEQVWEAHVLDWQGDLYGQELEIRLEQALRPEMQFDGVDALKKQIAADVEAARGILSQLSFS
jgi:riboflavin kinase/FMN adenylyltransferase